MIGEIEAVVDALNRAQVRYLVVGGVAVVLHGYLRTTADLDLVIHLAPDNALRAVKAWRRYSTGHELRSTSRPSRSGKRASPGYARRA